MTAGQLCATGVSSYDDNHGGSCSDHVSRPLTDDEDCADCGAILEELENIDDEADMYGEEAGRGSPCFVANRRHTDGRWKFWAELQNLDAAGDSETSLI